MIHLVLAGALVTLVPPESPRLYLGTGGGLPGEPEFKAVLEDGVLTVTRTALSHVKRSTETTEVAVPLTPEDVATLVDLGMAVDDLDVGCLGDEGADFTSALLYVETDTGVNERRAEHCPRWPLGPKAKSFVETLNEFLPEDHRVF